MTRLYPFVPVLALFYGLPGAFGDVLAVEGKISIPAKEGGTEPATFAVEDMVFHLAGAGLCAFAEEYGPGRYVVQVEGDFDLRSRRVLASRVVLKQRI